MKIERILLLCFLSLFLRPLNPDLMAVHNGPTAHIIDVPVTNPPPGLLESLLKAACVAYNLDPDQALDYYKTGRVTFHDIDLEKGTVYVDFGIDCVLIVLDIP